MMVLPGKEKFPSVLTLIHPQAIVEFILSFKSLDKFFVIVQITLGSLLVLERIIQSFLGILQRMRVIFNFNGRIFLRLKIFFLRLI